jgi:hypothetical protein
MKSMRRSEALHGIIKAMDLWKEKKAFQQKVTDALFTILKRKDLTIFDVLIKRDEKVCEILDEPTKDVPAGKVLVLTPSLNPLSAGALQTHLLVQGGLSILICVHDPPVSRALE